MDSLSLIKSPITTELEDFKNLFDSSLSSSNLLLNNVIAHIRQRNGKMMRPILVLLVAKLYGEIKPATLHAAVSLELLHNKVAVLVGDFLLATSLVHAERTRNHDIIGVVACLGQDLAEGEILQLSNVSNREYSETIYFDVIRKKTAALFAACTKAAALSVEITEFARLFGENIGICFQIKDDIFDYFESKEIGKPTGNDMLEGKLTLPALYVLNTTNDAWAQEMALKVKDGTATVDEIARLIEFIKQNGGIEYAIKVMYEYKKRALDLLRILPDSVVKTALITYVDYVVDRDK